MQRLIICLTLAAIAIPTFPVVVEAQTRINELQQRARGTTISGKVISVVGNDFTLNDGSGEIVVDAGPRWWRELDIKPGEEVTITGEISKKSGEFDAFTINRANGAVIEIRPSEGPPPWAGGPNRDRPKPPKG
ncbi:NirD/YgiW/YdeI family stress tolerance protein [Aliterella atlantica]|uniref:DNA-binding protein n=1 Tax=Aliterella atlantica CENA595 TaxID=1618023 RepID=A0A0D8ZLV2_9CYAN|nr:NirD/YgiW/YdeI family stress tolerance protein [Aliterella atlantica]KJH69377.1 DNA-binding protein [Aliterella atlantica CENA595]